MLDDTQTIDGKATLTPKPQPPKQEPIAVATLMSDGTVTPLVNTHWLELHRLLLNAAHLMSAGSASHAMLAERVIAQIDERYDGLDDDIKRAIRMVLPQQQPAS